MWTVLNLTIDFLYESIAARVITINRQKMYLIFRPVGMTLRNWGNQLVIYIALCCYDNEAMNR